MAKCIVPVEGGWRWTWNELGVDLHVSDAAATTMNRHRQPFGGVERGGLLFVDPGHPVGLVLARVTPPHAADKASEHSIIMDPARCAREIHEANMEGLRLIGFWHSHPEEVPNLSTIDINNFRSLGHRNVVDLPWPVAIIVGRDPRAEGVRAWSVRPDRIYRAERSDPIGT